jgi:hypothetical protein
VFHGSPNALAYSKRYSLEPLRDGPSALNCDMLATVQYAELKSLKIGRIANDLAARRDSTVLLPSARWISPPIQALASANRLTLISL